MLCNHDLPELAPSTEYRGESAYTGAGVAAGSGALRAAKA